MDMKFSKLYQKDEMISTCNWKSIYLVMSLKTFSTFNVHQEKTKDRITRCFNLRGIPRFVLGQGQ